MQSHHTSTHTQCDVTQKHTHSVTLHTQCDVAHISKQESFKSIPRIIGYLKERKKHGEQMEGQEYKKLLMDRLLPE